MKPALILALALVLPLFAIAEKRKHLPLEEKLVRQQAAPADGAAESLIDKITHELRNEVFMGQMSGQVPLSPAAWAEFQFFVRTHEHLGARTGELNRQFEGLIADFLLEFVSHPKRKVVAAYAQVMIEFYLEAVVPPGTPPESHFVSATLEIRLQELVVKKLLSLSEKSCAGLLR